MMGCIWVSSGPPGVQGGGVRPYVTWVSSFLKAKGHGGTGPICLPGASLILAKALAGEESASVLALQSLCRDLQSLKGPQGHSIPNRELNSCLLTSSEGPLLPPEATCVSGAAPILRMNVLPSEEHSPVPIWPLILHLLYLRQPCHSGGLKFYLPDLLHTCQGCS